jgi:hypothetical protein
LGAAYVSFTFRGANGGGINSGTYGTVFDATGFGDRPAINVAGARQVVLEDFSVIGKNVAPQTANLSPTKANWITAGCVDSQHSPYAGIAFDADYQGNAGRVVPGDPYPNFLYNATCSCSGAIIRNVKVSGFVVGLMDAPYAGGMQDGGPVSVYDSSIGPNTYNWSCGSSQAETIVFNNTWMYDSWCSITNNIHGGQEGHIPSIYGGGIFGVWKIFDVSAENAAVISRLHCENFAWLGNFSLAAGSSSAALPIKFEACHFT